MAVKPCGTSFGHEDCGYTFMVQDREGHVADRDSWQRTSKIRYKQHMIKQAKKK